MVQIQGTVVAPEEPSEWDPQSPRLWLLFSGLAGARIQGGGVIDGSGSKWWASSCKINRSNVRTPVHLPSLPRSHPHYYCSAP
jgi:galacturan 1,4-alpha-galacturonidase